jgi:murein DD-endopeptidase MepM/ murein hydrolase activator NlpD
MRRRRGWPFHAAALTLLILPASCVPPAAPPASAPPPAPVPSSTPAPAPPPTPLHADFAILRGIPVQGGTLLGQVPDTTQGLTLDGKPVPVAADGRFLIAFDRDAASEQHLVATLADGRRVEHVNTPWRGSASSDAEFQRRRPAELAQIAEARRVDHDVDGWRQIFRWPATGRLSGFFGSQRVYQGKPGSYHSGTDIAVPAGTPFYAPADGVVTLAATTPFTLEGNLLMIDHGMGLNSAFLHCQHLDVKVGDRVVQGQRLGTTGSTGRATGPHLHWGLKWRDARLDPATLAGPMPR